MPLNLPIQVMSSPARLEPGVLGIFRPVLLLPEGIADRLTPPQLEAILAHELRHVQRRDNLTAAIHMVVETLFWFHPLVWWIRARLVEERELACDEGVLRLGSEPQVYAESILKVCEFYLASPVACAAGVTGGELKRRIEGIMENRYLRSLSLGKKILLAVAGLMAVGTPIVVGMSQGGTQPAREALALRQPTIPKNNHYEVVSIKPGLRSAGVYGYHSSPGEIRLDNISIRLLIGAAFRVPDDRLIGLPAWAS
jgi:beta-lactamase regulating signal transducer with metallopeptidase domain